MNAAETRAPEAGGAEGTRLAPGRSSRPRRRGRPDEWPAAAAAAAPGGADEWPAAGAPLRFLLAPPPRPHPAAASGPASGWLRRWRWAALLVLGLLVAGAADGCELVPRHLRGRRASGSAAAAASSPPAAAGDSPALMTGEGRRGGRRAGQGRLLRDPHLWEGPIPLPGARYTTATASARCGAGRSDASTLAASSRSPTVRTPFSSPPPPHPALDRASRRPSLLRPRVGLPCIPR